MFGALGPSAVALSSVNVAQSDGAMPHPNMQPFLVVNYIIALTGLYPERA